MTERRIVMFNQVSADGYFSGKDGDLDWVVSDPEIHERAIAGMPQTDTILFGRRTYQRFEAFWPSAAASGVGSHGSAGGAASLGAMADWINGSRKLVFSKSLAKVTWRGSEIERQLSVERITELKKGPGKDLMIFGSGSIVSQLTEQGSIDEYRFVICPVLLGDGVSLLRQVSRRLKLELTEHASFRSGNLLLTYRPQR
jgi:dihydrofolate reductase